MGGLGSHEFAIAPRTAVVFKELRRYIDGCVRAIDRAEIADSLTDNTMFSTQRIRKIDWKSFTQTRGRHKLKFARKCTHLPCCALAKHRICTLVTRRSRTDTIIATYYWRVCENLIGGRLSELRTCRPSDDCNCSFSGLHVSIMIDHRPKQILRIRKFIYQFIDNSPLWQHLMHHYGSPRIWHTPGAVPKLYTASKTSTTIIYLAVGNHSPMQQ